MTFTELLDKADADDREFILSVKESLYLACLRRLANRNENIVATYREFLDDNHRERLATHNIAEEFFHESHEIDAITDSVLDSVTEYIQNILADA